MDPVKLACKKDIYKFFSFLEANDYHIFNQFSILLIEYKTGKISKKELVLS